MADLAQHVEGRRIAVDEGVGSRYSGCERKGELRSCSDCHIAPVNKANHGPIDRGYQNGLHSILVEPKWSDIHKTIFSPAHQETNAPLRRHFLDMPWNGEVIA